MNMKLIGGYGQLPKKPLVPRTYAASVVVMLSVTGDCGLLSVTGADAVKGGNGQDRLERGGKDDGLFGAAGDEPMWQGSSSIPAMPTTSRGADYLDGGNGNDRPAGCSDEFSLGSRPHPHKSKFSQKAAASKLALGVLSNPSFFALRAA